MLSFAPIRDRSLITYPRNSYSGFARLIQPMADFISRACPPAPTITIRFVASEFYRLGAPPRNSGMLAWPGCAMPSRRSTCHTVRARIRTSSQKLR